MTVALNWIASILECTKVIFHPYSIQERQNILISDAYAPHQTLKNTLFHVCYKQGSSVSWLCSAI